MQNFIISLILGILPDVLYYFIYTKQIKGIKSKNLLFFFLLLVTYMLCIIAVRHQFYLYIIQDILVFIIMKLLYKSHISDMFLVIFIEFYMILLSTICFMFINNYYFAFIIYRLLMFLPLLFSNKLRDMYKKYLSLWNRHDNPKKIKSITLRNVSLVILNCLLIFMYLITLYITSK